jgi:hypothetical protein
VRIPILGWQLEGGDKMKLVSLFAGLLIWWVFIGRPKYGVKGLNRYV